LSSGGAQKAKPAAETFASALSCQQRGEIVRAERDYRALLVQDPGHADALNNLGVLLNGAGRNVEALECFSSLAFIEAKSPRAEANLGATLRALGRRDEALAAYRRALAISPSYTVAHGNLGNLLYEMEQYPKAVEHFAQAAQLSPTSAEYRFMLAKALLECQRHERAAAELASVIVQEPAHADAWGTFARVWAERHRMAEALLCFERGLEAKPDYAGLMYNRGLARLLAGDLPGGFADYERRFDVPDFPSKRLKVKQPLWNGQPLPNHTLLLHAEQGLGDTLQFLRYLPEAAKRVQHALLLIQETLTPLLAAGTLPDNVVLLHEGQPLPHFDVVCPLLSLPHLFGTNLLSIPATVPYLYVDAARSQDWERRLAGTSLRVGLVWAGNPSHKNDANRSLDLAELQPLFALPGIRFFSLQFGPRSTDIVRLGLTEQLTDLAPHISNFADTAAALTELDLLVCVDTSSAHLAGALGLPVWLLVPWMPDWRWLLEREDSPWYPSLRILRQPRYRDWANVVDRLAHDLKELAAPASAAGKRRLASADFLVEEGRPLLERGQFDLATPAFWRALRECPTHARTSSALAVASFRTGQPRAAVTFGSRACRLNPKDPEAFSNLGAYLKAQGNIEEALKAQQEAIRLAPRNASAQSNLGNTLGALGRWEEAKTAAQRAVRLAPDSPEFHYNLGIALKESADFAAALRAFRAAQRLGNGHVKACLHEALIELLTGDLANGWKHYESRWLQPDCKESRSFDRPLWNGEPLAGKRILIHAEQGFGDSFQFLRYLPLLAEQGAHVILVVQPELETLATRIRGLAQLLPSGSSLPAFDMHCPLLSLPRAFDTTLETIPASIPYLQMDPQRKRQWHTRLRGLRRYRVGLVWAGRPTHANDANRSLSLGALQALLDHPVLDCVSLQKGSAVDQIAVLPTPCRLLDLGKEITSFDDTAAILGELDELVSVDTSIAHLAGGLGCRVRLLLPRIPDWRWLWNRADSPWYPTMKLYRQIIRGDWTVPLRALREDLLAAALAKQRKD
jgi:tetratricopeptide (TPR) repeat protein